MDQEVARADGSAPSAASTLPLTLLLSGTGGYLDAFTWIGHGHVFANAQSGNVVLLGIDIATGGWSDAWRRLMPIVAFFFGVFAAYWVKGVASRKDQGWLTLPSLGVEIVVLGVVATLPSSFASAPIVLAVSFVTAFQSSIFNRLENWPYNSVMTSGNLRMAAESLFQWVARHRDRASLDQAAKFGAVCLSFCVGAAVGGVATAAIGNAASIGPAILLGAALLVCLRDGRVLSN